MQHENDGKQLKQERKCEYKILTLHVAKNEILSFSFSTIGCHNDTILRDSERPLVQLTQWGCITAPMEKFKSISTASLKIENSKVNPKDLLLTRVKIDPSFLIQVRYFYSKLVNASFYIKVRYCNCNSKLVNSNFYQMFKKRKSTYSGPRGGLDSIKPRPENRMLLSL